MFEFTAGGVRPRRPARSERGALERMVGAMTQSRPEGTEGRGAVLRAAVMEAQAAESADRLLGLVTGAVPTADVFEAPFSSVMIAHTGPGLVGLAWWWEASDGGSVR
jgi:fatty acid-binding protein DegV